VKVYTKDGYIELKDAEVIRKAGPVDAVIIGEFQGMRVVCEHVFYSLGWGPHWDVNIDHEWYVTLVDRGLMTCKEYIGLSKRLRDALREATGS
jgi:hypothetical protein